MTPIAIAANRFGLGMRGDAPLAGDAKAGLLRQLERFEPRPAALANAPSRADIAGTLAQFYAERKADKQARAEGQMAANSAPPAAEAMTAPARGQPRTKAQRSPEFVEARDAVREIYTGSIGARLDAALVSPAPFVERLVHFWANHFAVSADKPPVVAFAGSLEFDAIRPHVLGRFGAMLRAVEQHPAMLIYLDQVQSIGPASPAGQRRAAGGSRKAGLNENLAREILELHTLGVRSGYTQADVTEFARAMTGWFVTGLGQGGGRAADIAAAPGNTVFREHQHEPGSRTILGRSYNQAGAAQSLAVLDDLAAHPATARHIATKLARHFAGDAPPPALVDRLAETFHASGGDLPEVYRVLIDAPECWAAAPARFKTPWDWCVSASRALGLSSLDAKFAANMLVALGQQVWKPGSPAGYDDVDASWAAPDALMRRIEMAQRIAQRAGGGVDARALAQAVLPGSVSTATQAALANAESGPQALAMLLVSPEFLRR